jgi:hypothetical protein
MAKTFENLYSETGVDNEPLDWEWDPQELVFRATDSSMRVYTLRPLSAELETDDSDVEQEDEDYEE